MPDLSIIIVNWNSGSQLAECLASVATATGGAFRLKELLVVDNASTDSSANNLFPHRLPLQVIRNAHNRGFAAACNQGAARTSADYFLFLNPDVRLFPDTLHVAITHLERPENARVGICGVQLVDEQEHVVRSCSRLPGARQFLAAMLGLERLMPLVFPPQRMTDWRHEATADVEQVMGAFFLVRASTFRALAGFDERFFLYYEEVDFSLRAGRAGWTSRYLVAARAFHRGGGTTDQIKAQRLLYSLRSRLLYSFKHFTLVSAVAVLLGTLLVEPVTRCAISLWRRGWEGVLETLAAYRSLWRSLPAITRGAAADHRRPSL